jgi:Rhodopirellula transposase DDE domain
LIEIVSEFTAGDPMREEVIWTSLTPGQIADELSARGTPVCRDTAQDLLDAFGYHRRQARKNVPLGTCEHRDEQFRNIAELKEQYLAAGDPVISMDTKKKEYLGNFHRPGRVWTTGLIETLDHDFHRSGDGSVVIPHGLYDVGRNVGHITLGTSHDTSQFACESFQRWWFTVGRLAYPWANSLLLLCDCGGSNGYRHHIFKEDLQTVVNEIGIPIQVAHYPPYCSKYNPIEHRLFPHITRACQGVIFHTLDVVKQFIKRTSTRTGLTVTLSTLTKHYEIKRKATRDFLAAMPVLFEAQLPKLNYILIPQPG